MRLPPLNFWSNIYISGSREEGTGGKFQIFVKLFQIFIKIFLKSFKILLKTFKIFT